MRHDLLCSLRFSPPRPPACPSPSPPAPLIGKHEIAFTISSRTEGQNSKRTREHGPQLQDTWKKKGTRGEEDGSVRSRAHIAVFVKEKWLVLPSAIRSRAWSRGRSTTKSTTANVSLTPDSTPPRIYSGEICCPTMDALMQSNSRIKEISSSPVRYY